MRNGFGRWVLAADGGDTGVRGLSSLGKGVVAAIKVLALLRHVSRAVCEAQGSRSTHLESVLQQIRLVWQLSVEAEEPLLLRREGLLGCQYCIISRV